MTVNEYRNKHQKCLYCKYRISHSQPDVLYSRSFPWCIAKEKSTSDNKGRFCKIFSAKDFKEEKYNV